ncbi:DoxX family protein [Nonomuraea sediminis]|uniref:DoxX family protein n=1 Tax=Nonomuraea sediminis TaxID=2835864 RepID=UPI001BDC5B59|nr:DoxX family protein [Nonomuraea sediminis]
MQAAYVAVTLLTIVANAGAAVADFARAEVVLVNAAAVGIPRSWLPALALPKVAGAAGLLLGLLGVRLIGTAAAAGLVLFFAGALAVHVRAGVFRTTGIPAAFFALAAASLVLATLT